MSGSLVKTSLETFNIHKVEDKMVAAYVDDVLKNENLYIANQVDIYLEKQDNLEKKNSYR